MKGKRTIKFLSLDEYKTIENNTITEVDEDIGFSVCDFYDNLGKYKEDIILDSTQTFLQKYCQDLQNVVCTTDIQTQGRGIIQDCD